MRTVDVKTSAIVVGVLGAAAGLAWLGAGPGEPPVSRAVAPVASMTPGVVAAPAPTTVAVVPAASASARLPAAHVTRSPAGERLAVIAEGDGPARPHRVGDALAPGVRVARVDRDAVWIERAGPDVHRIERVPVASPAVETTPVTAPEPSVVTGTPGRPHPAVSPMDRWVANVRSGG